LTAPAADARQTRTAAGGDLLPRALLLAGVVAPIGYFAVQIAAAQFYPGYDFRHQVASELGVAGHDSAAFFNGGVMALGALYALAGVGAFLALRRARAPIILAVLVGLCLISHALSAFNAAYYPLPDPRHNPGALGLGLFALPPLAAITSLFIKAAPIARAVLWICVLGFAILAAIMSGVTPIDARVEPGAWQRVAAFVFNLPVIVLSASLLARVRSGETA
jgi:hypothetical protein